LKPSIDQSQEEEIQLRENLLILKTAAGLDPLNLIGDQLELNMVWIKNQLSQVETIWRNPFLSFKIFSKEKLFGKIGKVFN